MGQTQHERALTPIVGVILLVGITMLLAATAGAMFLGLTDSNADEDPPTTAFGFDYEPGSDDRLTVRHESGDTVDADNVHIVIEDAETASGTVTIRESWSDLATGSPDTVMAGDSVTVSTATTGHSDLSLDDASGRVVWTDPDTGRTFTLVEWQAGSS